MVNVDTAQLVLCPGPKLYEVWGYEEAFPNDGKLYYRIVWTPAQKWNGIFWEYETFHTWTNRRSAQRWAQRHGMIEAPKIRFKVR